MELGGGLGLGVQWGLRWGRISGGWGCSEGWKPIWVWGWDWGCGDGEGSMGEVLGLGMQ